MTRSLRRRVPRLGNFGLLARSLVMTGLVALSLPHGPVDVYAQDPSTLDIYWIDVEGGAATLVVTPQRESILMDTGWNRADARDAGRIQAAMRDAGISEIDYVLLSHFHADHMGGLAALIERVPIARIVDHGDSVEQAGPRGRAVWDEYVGLSRDRRLSVRPGDTLPLADVEFTFVASHRELVDSLGPRSPNGLCAEAEMPAPDEGENGHSLGYLVSLGGFQFLNLGDLTPDREYALACPENRLGVVDLYQVPHHGAYGAIRPELTGALEPTAVVINNGPRKGGTPDSLGVVQSVAGIEDVWQAHRALADDAAYNTEEPLIANLTEEEDCTGYWIKASVQADGRNWTMTNGRTGHSRNYESK